MRTHHRFLRSSIVISLLVVLAACQPGGAVAPSGAAPTTSSAASPTAASAQPTSASGALDLANPLASLANLKSYHALYSSTVKGSQQGQALETQLSVEAWANGADQAALVQQTATGSQPVYLHMAAIGGQKYTQQKAGGACRTAAGAEALITKQTLKLPPVFGARPVGPETLNGIPAVHYQFDEKSVAWQAGQTGKAHGELWVAAEGGAVLKYTLSIQYPSGDFQVTRTWSFELSDVDAGQPVALTQGCLPVLTDLPLMDGAAEVVQRPGFQKYAVSAPLEQVIQFYADKMTAAGWSVLPGVEPQGGKVTLEYAQAQAGGGSRLAVIQAAEAGGQTGVVVQVAQTRLAVVPDPTPVPGSEPTGEEPTEAAEPGDPNETPGESASLPADLPVYPGAEVVVQNDQMMMLKTGDTPEQVTAFYKQALADAGLSLDNETSMNGISTQSWTQDSLTIALVVMAQGGSTQITVSAQ